MIRMERKQMIVDVLVLPLYLSTTLLNNKKMKMVNNIAAVAAAAAGRHKIRIHHRKREL